MPDHIHTIPVLDALREPNGCAFCAMKEKLEDDALQFIMGPSYMEDDVRMETNKIGFCKRHLDAMYKEQNRLGLGLMLHTHIARINKDAAGIVQSRVPAPFFGKDKSNTLARLRGHLQKVHGGCYVCEKVEDTFARYIDTFFYLWKKGGDEAALIRQQKGYCVPHFIQVLEYAEGLGRGKREQFIDEILPSFLGNLQELEGDIEWFTLKFDFRNADEPWKNSKDALPRAVKLLAGE